MFRAFAIVVFVLGLFSFIFGTKGYVFPQDGAGWFYHYQGFIAGLIALASAFASIQYAWNRHLESQKKKELVARSILHDTLSEICSYADQSFHIQYDMCKGNDVSLPEKPTNSVRELKYIIEFLDIDTAESVSRLLSHYQVHNARFQKCFEMCKLRVNWILNYPYWMLYDSTLLYQYASQLFAYARSEVLSEKPRNPTNEEMKSSLYAVTRNIPTTDRVISWLLEEIDKKHPE